MVNYAKGNMFVLLAGLFLYAFALNSLVMKNFRTFCAFQNCHSDGLAAEEVCWNAERCSLAADILAAAKQMGKTCAKLWKLWLTSSLHQAKSQATSNPHRPGRLLEILLSRLDGTCLQHKHSVVHLFLLPLRAILITPKRAAASNGGRKRRKSEEPARRKEKSPMQHFSPRFV